MMTTAALTLETLKAIFTSFCFFIFPDRHLFTQIPQKWQYFFSRWCMNSLTHFLDVTLTQQMPHHSHQLYPPCASPEQPASLPRGDTWRTALQAVPILWSTSQIVWGLRGGKWLCANPFLSMLPVTRKASSSTQTPRQHPLHRTWWKTQDTLSLLSFFPLQLA